MRTSQTAALTHLSGLLAQQDVSAFGGQRFGVVPTWGVEVNYVTSPKTATFKVKNRTANDKRVLHQALAHKIRGSARLRLTPAKRDKVDWWIE